MVSSLLCNRNEVLNTYLLLQHWKFKIRWKWIKSYPIHHEVDIQHGFPTQQNIFHFWSILANSCGPKIYTFLRVTHKSSQLTYISLSWLTHSLLWNMDLEDHTVLRKQTGWLMPFTTGFKKMVRNYFKNMVGLNRCNIRHVKVSK